jgi:hypothetical protein
MDDERLNRAVRDCLQHCYQATDIVPKVAEFLDKLERTEGWNTASIRAVEMTVYRILHGVVSGPIYPGDATNQPPGTAGSAGSGTTKLNGA